MGADHQGRQHKGRNDADSSTLPAAEPTDLATESGSMSVNNKRVFYVKYLSHQIYADS